MKKIAILSLALTTTCLSAFTADLPIKPWENPSQSLKIVNICHLTDDDLNEIMQGKHPETVVEFSEKTNVPIHCFLKGDLLNLIENEGKFGVIEIKQTLYARCVGEELTFSLNLTDWKPFLELTTGNISIRLTIHDGAPSIALGGEMNYHP